MKEYKATFKVEHRRVFNSYYTFEKETVKASTFKEAREKIRNKYNNISNIIIEEIKEKERE